MKSRDLEERACRLAAAFVQSIALNGRVLLAFADRVGPPLAPRVEQLMKRILRQFADRDAHPVIQFIKYGIAGGIATMVDVGAFYLFSILWIPALQPDDRMIIVLHWLHEFLVGLAPALADWQWLYEAMHIQVAPIAVEVRERNFVINRCIVFFLSNFTAYMLNRLWVFKPGRHRAHMEIVLFYAVATISFIVGTSLGWGLIAWLGISTTDAYAANLVSAVLINYVCRKYIVFRG
jgi:putative flippase GtrA